MANRRIVGTGRRGPSEVNTPTQQDEADILKEVGAETDESGALSADEDAVRELGAVDSESVRENRRLEAVVSKKRANVPRVSFNAGDLITQYETLIKMWTANTIDIGVKRMTGEPVQQVIISRPRSGVELYAAIKSIHGEYSEAEYEIKFFDSNSKQFRGTGRITMPDTRPPTQQGQPMQPMYPPGYAPPGYAPPGYPPPQQPAAPQQPAVMPVQPAPLANDPMAMMRGMFELFQQMQGTLQPAQPPQPQFAPPPPPQFVMPAPPSPQATQAEMLDYTRRTFELFQQMMAGQHAPVQPPPPPPQQPPPNPLTLSAPPFPPPPGMFWAPPYGYLPIPTVAAPQQPETPRGGPMYRNPMARGPERSPYERPYEPPPPPPPPPAPKTAAEQFRETITFVKTARDAVREMNDLMPREQQQAAYEPTYEDDDESPVRVVEAGPAKILYDKKSGSMRGWETAFANLPDAFKWLGEQREKIQEAHAEQQRQQRPQAPQRTLPSGYVEVGPGYQPPAGFVAVPVDQSELPPPPQNIPPPIHPVQQPQRRTWSAPTIPEEEKQ